MEALNELKSFGVNLEDIKRIEYKGYPMNIQATWSLLEETDVEDMLEGIFIYTNKGIVLTEETENGLTKISYTPITKSKKRKEITPISLRTTWWSNEYNESLPYKDEKTIKEEEERHKKRRKQFIETEERNLKNKEEYLKVILDTQNSEKIAPFTLFTGGQFNNCYYVTIPKTATIDSGFHFDMVDDEFVDLIDWVGYAKTSSGKLKTLTRFVKTEDYFTTTQKNVFPEKVAELTEMFKELLTKTIEADTISYAIGFSPERYYYWLDNKTEYKELSMKETMGLLIESLKKKFNQ